MSAPVALGRRAEQDQGQLCCFALVVCQHIFEDGVARYVVVHEKLDRGWWLPGGGVDHGQTFAEAAERESIEEAGIGVKLTGVLRIEFESLGTQRMRVIFLAQPKDPQSLNLKTTPDKESRGARWCTFEEIQQIGGRTLHQLTDDVPAETCHLRGPEPLFWALYLERRGKVAPLDVLHMRKNGEVPPWPGPGDPPRALYPTTLSIKTFALTRMGDASKPHALLDACGGLPTFALNLSSCPKSTAAEIAQQWKFELAGIILVRHAIDCSASNLDSHYATLEIIFKMVAVPSSPAPGGFQWVGLDEPVSSLRPGQDELRDLADRELQAMRVLDSEMVSTLSDGESVQRQRRLYFVVGGKGGGGGLGGSGGSPGGPRPPPGGGGCLAG